MAPACRHTLSSPGQGSRFRVQGSGFRIEGLGRPVASLAAKMSFPGELHLLETAHTGRRVMFQILLARFGAFETMCVASSLAPGCSSHALLRKIEGWQYKPGRDSYSRIMIIFHNAII